MHIYPKIDQPKITKLDIINDVTVTITSLKSQIINSKITAKIPEPNQRTLNSLLGRFSDTLYDMDDFI
jgi:hypothetical protein